MGHGWQDKSSYVDKRKCNCGKGFIYTKVIVQESDYPPFEREERDFLDEWSDCPDNCENKRK